MIDLIWILFQVKCMLPKEPLQTESIPEVESSPELLPDRRPGAPRRPKISEMIAKPAENSLDETSPESSNYHIFDR